MLPSLTSTVPLRLPLRVRRGLTLTAALALIAILPAAALASSAQAALISTATCNDATLTQPFLRWGDSNSYELVPGGDFEGSLAGWSLSGGAQRVAGGEPYEVDGSVGAHSLELPAGASAQSPFTCVTAAYPTFRLFARNEGLLSSVIVQVVSQTALGTVVLPLGVIAGSSQWQPTPPMLTGSIVTGALSGGTAQVALRFTALGGGSRIDDVFVDPRMI